MTDQRAKFKIVSKTLEEEDNFDYVAIRNLPKPNNVVEAIGHMVKGALGAGVLGGHVAHMKAGVYPALSLHCIFGIYITYCLYMLGKSTQRLKKRTQIPFMSYPDVGEAALLLFPNPKIARWSKFFRYSIDFVVCLDLFGACACYQIIIAKTIKQLVEKTSTTTLEGAPGFPHLRLYMAAMILPIILICMIRHLKWLAPFTIVADIFLVFCAGCATYYAFDYNPKFENLQNYTSFYHLLEYVGMTVFSMSAASVVIPIENNMKDPKKFPFVLMCAMLIIVILVFFISFFGYVAFQDKCESPITVNFPLETVPIILKGCIAVMVFVTHALNFWVPFNLCFYYIKPKLDQDKLLRWEYIYRVIFVLLVSVIAICFPNINNLMGFLGAFCLCNMAFIWPVMIETLVMWHRPGLGTMKWRLWKNGFMLIVGLFIMVCGSIVNLTSLFKSIDF